MKWSKFILKIDDEKEYILYNTLNGSVIKLKKEIYNKILTKKVKPNILKALKSNEFIIDSLFDENANFMKSLLDEWNNCGFLSLHLVVTTGCNFRCPYCYQSGICAQMMSIVKAKEVLNYINHYVVENKIKESAVEITGGEPTTNWNTVEFLLKGINNIFKLNNIKYKTYIVTNGYNLTGEKADFISKYNWDRFQVTLDGLPKIHNKRRMLIDGSPTFDIIVENIGYILKNNKIAQINLRINYDKSNIEHIPAFLDFIKEKFGTKRISISLGLITKTVDDSEANSFINKNGIIYANFADNYINLYRYALNLGFKMPDIFSFDGMCTAKLKHGFLIEPNGNITKCVSGVGRKEFNVGNINNFKKLDNYLFPDIYEDCLSKNCPYLPICHTGCRFEAFIKNGNLKRINCKCEILNKINNDIIKINYGGGENVNY